MAMGKFLRVLGAVLAGLAGAAWAQSGADDPLWTTVQSGRNAGEYDRLTKLAVHPWNGGAYGFFYRRTHDAAGQIIPQGSETVASNTLSMTVPAVEGPCASGHGVGGLLAETHPYFFGAGFNWEAALIAQGSDPGRYKITVTLPNGQQGLVSEWEREFNKYPMKRSVNFRIKGMVNGTLSAMPGATARIFKPIVEQDILDNLGNVKLADQLGGLQAELSPGLYLITVYPPSGVTGFQNKPLWVEVPQIASGQGSVLQKDVVLPGTGQSNVLGGNLRVTVLLNDDKKTPIEGAAVHVASKSAITDHTGAVTITNIAQLDYLLNVSKQDFWPEQRRVWIVAGQTTEALIYLWPSAPNGDGGGDGQGDGGDGGFPLTPGWWQDLFVSLFVPQPGTWANWDALRAEVLAWGPFGAVAGFFAAWDQAARSGPILTQQWGFALGPGGTAVIAGTLDWRPLLAAELPDYEGGGRGSFYGSMRASVRPLLGYAVYGLFGFALWLWIRPRLSF